MITLLTSNLAGELGLLFLVLALVVCITILAALGVPVPDVLSKVLLFLAGGGAGVVMPAAAARLLSSTTRTTSSAAAGPPTP